MAIRLVQSHGLAGIGNLTCLQAFIEPLSREKLLSPQEVRYVAGNLTTIIALHEGINAKLKDGTPPEAAIIAVVRALLIIVLLMSVLL